MAHFTELDKDNMVINVIVVDNKDTANEQGDEAEQIGIDFLESLYGHNNWKQTSYNSHGGQHSRGKSNIRKNFAGIGFVYNSAKEAFIPPRQFASWTLDDTTCLWRPPKAYPQGGGAYKWNENIPDWVTK